MLPFISRCRVLGWVLWFGFFSSAAFSAIDLKSPLPVDPNIKQGRLENGLRYWIREHATPPKKVGLYLHIDSGSVNEEENQRGLAHYLEHLAFNGSKHFPPGTLVKFFESIGMRFGSDQNAFTGFDQTTYILVLPNVETETLDKGLMFMSDVALGLSLLPNEVDKERNVILEEQRMRKGAGQRMRDKLIPILLPGSLVAERMPIGKEEVIKEADVSRLRAYYEKWYRPDNTTLLVVGDVTSAELEKHIAKHFSAWNPVSNVPANRNPGIKPYTTSRAAVLTDPELTSTEVSAVNILPLYQIETVGDYRESLVRNAGSWIMNRRFEDLIQKGTAPFQEAQVHVTSFLNVATYVSAGVEGKADQWERMMTTLLAELKRARTHGFLEQELSDAKRAVLAEAEQAARIEGTLDMRVFLGEMNRSLSEGRKPMSAGQRLDLVKELMPTIELKEVDAAFGAHFKDQHRLLLVEMPEKQGLKNPKEEELVAAAARAEAAEVQALAAKERPKTLLDREPEPGEMESLKDDRDLNILSAKLSNGVRVHVRSMEVKKDQAWVKITLAGGELQETAANRGITEVATLAFQQLASKNRTSIEIRDLMTGKNVMVLGQNERDGITLNIAGSTKDLQEGFRLAYLLLTEGKIEASAMKVWREQQFQAIEKRKIDVNSHLQETFRALLYADDPRLKFLTQEQTRRLTLDECQTWLDQLLATAPIEAAIVGDFEPAQALEWAKTYLGSLPARPLGFSDLKRLRKMKIEKGLCSREVEVPTITPQAHVILGWRAAELKDVKECRALELASQILQSRLLEEIREARGLTYSIGCFNLPGVYYEDTGFLAAYFQADPQKAREAAGVAREFILNFMKEGPTDEQWATAKKQLAVKRKADRAEPRFWLDLLATFDYRERNLKDVKQTDERMDAFEKAEMLKILGRYLKDERYIQVLCLPSKQEALAPNATQEKKESLQKTAP